MKFHMITMLSIFLDIVAEAWSGILLSVQLNTLLWQKHSTPGSVLPFVLFLWTFCFTTSWLIKGSTYRLSTIFIMFLYVTDFLAMIEYWHAWRDRDSIYWAIPSVQNNNHCSTCPPPSPALLRPGETTQQAILADAVAELLWKVKVLISSLGQFWLCVHSTGWCWREGCLGNSWLCGFFRARTRVRWIHHWRPHREGK